MDKELFLAGPRPKVKQVEIDGHTVYLRALTAGDQMALQDAAGMKPADSLGRMLVASVTDEHGRRILSDEDLPAVLDMDGGYIAKLLEEVIKLNRFTSEEVDVLAGK